MINIQTVLNRQTVHIYSTTEFFSGLLLFRDQNVAQILNHTKLIKWFAKNAIMQHEKLQLIPIGITV